MAQATGLPDYDTAYQNVFGAVYSRVFFDRLAAGGYAPANEKQAQVMLEMSGKLRAAAESPQVKAAEEAQDPIFRANAMLDQLLGQQGLSKQAGVEESEVKRAADFLAEDPTIYNSILSLRAHEAAAISQQYNLQPAAAG